MLFVLALAGRQAALWLAFWIVSSIFIMLYMGESFTHPLSFFTAFPSLAEYLLAQILGLMAWEAAAHITRSTAHQRWLRARWLPRLLFACVMALLTARLSAHVAFGESAQWALAVLYLPPEETYWLLYAFCLCGAWLWYRRYMPDLFMLAYYMLYRVQRQRAHITTPAFYFQEGFAHNYAKAQYGVLRLGADGRHLLVNLADYKGKPMR